MICTRAVRPLPEIIEIAQIDILIGGHGLQRSYLRMFLLYLSFQLSLFVNESIHIIHLPSHCLFQVLNLFFMLLHLFVQVVYFHLLVVQLCHC